MSFSVDDLVSSLNSSHIGQEALDLAALQAQLAETLFGGNPASSSSSNNNGGGRQMQMQIPRGRTQHTQPCNTPLARTPSSSISGWSSMYPEPAASSSYHSRRSSSVSSAHGQGQYSSYHDEMEEDERMVEELLLPSSPPPYPSSSSSASNFSSSSSASYYPQPTSYTSPPQTPAPTFSSSSFSSSYPSPTYPIEPPPASPASASLFTTTDPFYIAQVQAAQQQQMQQTQFESQSAFAQNGRLSQSSPFAIPQQYHQFGHAQNWGVATTAF